MTELIINIDVPDIAAAEAFYGSAFGLSVARRYDAEFVELGSANLRVFLLQKDAGTTIGPAGGDKRRYARHWSPLHFDVVVNDLEAASARAVAAGAVVEEGTTMHRYGRLAMFADPFGHGFCLIEFNADGYDAA